MSDWQLDLMYETESARLCEEEQKHSAAWDKMLDSVGYINVALEHLDKATDSLIQAKDQLDGLSCEYKVGSLIDSLEDLICDIQKIRQQLINGEG